MLNDLQRLGRIPPHLIRKLNDFVMPIVNSASMIAWYFGWLLTPILLLNAIPIALTYGYFADASPKWGIYLALGLMVLPVVILGFSIWVFQRVYVLPRHQQEIVDIFCSALERYQVPVPPPSATGWFAKVQNGVQQLRRLGKLIYDLYQMQDRSEQEKMNWTFNAVAIMVSPFFWIGLAVGLMLTTLFVVGVPLVCLIHSFLT